MAAEKVIRVDADVYAAIQKQGKFGETTNDVLRRMLNMEAHDVRTKHNRNAVRTTTSRISVSK